MLLALREHTQAFHQRRTWQLMAEQEIRMRYRRSKIGPFWISIALGMQILGIGLLFSQIFDQPLDDFIVFVAAGLLMWSMINGLIVEGCTALNENEGHLRALPIPVSIFAARNAYRQLIIFGHNIIIVAVLMFAFGLQLKVALITVPFAVLVVLAVGYFWTVFIAPWCLRFRDITQVITSIMSVAFFLTPIFWQPGQGRVSNIVVQLNPFFHLVELVRAPVLGQVATLTNWTVSLGMIVFLALLSFISLRFSRGRIYLWL